MGLLNNVAPFTLITWGQSHIESGMAVIFLGLILVDGRLLRRLAFR